MEGRARQREHHRQRSAMEDGGDRNNEQLGLAGHLRDGKLVSPKAETMKGGLASWSCRQWGAITRF